MRNEFVISECPVYVLRRKQEIEFHAPSFDFQALWPNNLRLREGFSPSLQRQVMLPLKHILREHIPRDPEQQCT